MPLDKETFQRGGRERQIKKKVHPKTASREKKRTTAGDKKNTPKNNRSDTTQTNDKISGSSITKKT